MNNRNEILLAIFIILLLLIVFDFNSRLNKMEIASQQSPIQIFDTKIFSTYTIDKIEGNGNSVGSNNKIQNLSDNESI